MERARQRAIEQGLVAEKVRLEQDVLAYLASRWELHCLVLDPEVDFWRQIKTGSSVIPANKLYLTYFQQVYHLTLENVTLGVCPPQLKEQMQPFQS